MASTNELEASLQALTPGTWTVDTAHSSVGFVARHLMVSKVRGKFTSFSGTITVPEDPLASVVEATAAVTSIDTGDAKRDEHLRSADFFDADRFPAITFRSTGIERSGDGFVLQADVTIRDVTRSVAFELEFDGVSPDPWGGLRAGFAAEAEINRKDFGLVWNVSLETGGVLVGEKVKLVLEVEAIRS
jgi:polyisoprenoid-binding protein YceI